MQRILQADVDTSKEVLVFAKKNYRTYKNHFLSKGLKPISFEEFLKNYNL